MSSNNPLSVNPGQQPVDVEQPPLAHSAGLAGIPDRDVAGGPVDSEIMENIPQVRDNSAEVQHWRQKAWVAGGLALGLVAGALLHRLLADSRPGWQTRMQRLPGRVSRKVRNQF